MNTKDTNPKDAIGVKKAPMSVVPAQVMAELGLAMLEGATKYGRFNFRVAGVRASVYYDAAQRHLMAWFEGEDIDPASQLNHITKAIASLVVLRDSMLMGNWVDDRPPSVELGLRYAQELNDLAAKIIEAHADKNPHHHTQKEMNK